ncbi:MAG: CDP-alcohol phosphatidyltransferase family protein [Rhodospirillales bacterium]
MLDSKLRPLIDPPLRRGADLLVALGIKANTVTLVGFGFGLAGCVAVAFGAYLPALALLALNRLADGLDGAVARRTGANAFGGYLDIVCDFLIYNALVVAFALAQPDAAPAALFLLLAFAGSGTTFLAHAILAAKAGTAHERQGKKSFYYLEGLAEGTETIVFFALCLVFPAWFATLAWIFAGICALSVLGRVMATWRAFGRS